MTRTKKLLVALAAAAAVAVPASATAANTTAEHTPTQAVQSRCWLGLCQVFPKPWLW